MLSVCAKRCNECLFSSNKIVDEKRKKEVLAQCDRTDSHFICHKHTLRVLVEGAPKSEGNVCCRGFYDLNPSATNFMRIMARLGGVQFVDEKFKVVKK